MLGQGCVGETAGSQIVCLFATILTLAIFVRAILSWFQMSPASPLIQVLDAITEPILGPIRNVMPRLGMIDFSPLVAILLIQFVSTIIQESLG